MVKEKIIFYILGQKKGWEREIYKSGATTGLTSGTLSSCGHTINLNNLGAKSPLIIVRNNNIKFSEEGDLVVRFLRQ